MSYEQINTTKPITPREFTLAIVESVVSRHEGVTVNDVFGRSRKRPIVDARFEAIAEIAEARPHWSYPTIGRLFNRDHSTIMSALGKLGALRPRDYRDPEAILAAARSVGNFIKDYEAVADQKEYEAALAVTSFVQNFALPEWARGI